MPSDFYLLPALKNNTGGQNFKDELEVATVVTRRLITQDKCTYQQEIEKIGRLRLKCDSTLTGD